MGGFILGGLIVGALGCVYAPQVPLPASLTLCIDLILAGYSALLLYFGMIQYQI